MKTLLSMMMVGSLLCAVGCGPKATQPASAAPQTQPAPAPTPPPGAPPA